MRWGAAPRIRLADKRYKRRPRANSKCCFSKQIVHAAMRQTGTVSANRWLICFLIAQVVWRHFSISIISVRQCAIPVVAVRRWVWLLRRLLVFAHTILHFRYFKTQNCVFSNTRWVPLFCLSNRTSDRANNQQTETDPS